MNRELVERLQEWADDLCEPVGHYQCDDPWYSCPLSEEGCADDRQKGCTCGAEHREKHNKESAVMLREAAAALEASRKVRK